MVRFVFTVDQAYKYKNLPTRYKDHWQWIGIKKAYNYGNILTIGKEVRMCVFGYLYKPTAGTSGLASTVTQSHTCWLECAIFSSN